MQCWRLTRSCVPTSSVYPWWRQFPQYSLQAPPSRSFGGSAPPRCLTPNGKPSPAGEKYTWGKMATSHHDYSRPQQRKGRWSVRAASAMPLQAPSRRFFGGFAPQKCLIPSGKPLLAAATKIQHRVPMSHQGVVLSVSKAQANMFSKWPQYSLQVLLGVL